MPPTKCFLSMQRKELRRLVDRDDLQVHPEIAAARLGHLQPVEPLARAGEHDAAGDVHAAGLPGDLLDLLVELDGVLLQLGDIRIAVHGVHAARRVPGRARGRVPRARPAAHPSSRPWSGDTARWRRPRRRRSPPLARDFSSDLPSPARLHYRWIPPGAMLGARAPAECCRSARSARSGTARSPYR